MKLLVSATTDQIESYLEKGATGFLLPLKGYAADYQKTYSYEEIKAIKDAYPTISLFVVMNEMLFNEDLKEVFSFLQKIDALKVDGILFYDWAIYRLVKENRLQISLVWNQTHMVTNKQTADLLYQKGVRYGVLSTEMTKDEMIFLTQSKMAFFLPLVLYMPVGLTRRALLSHFYKSLGKNGEKQRLIKEQSSKMPFFVREGEKSTSLFYGKCFNAAPYYEELAKYPFAYGILKEDFLEHDCFLEVLSLYAKEKNNKKRIQKTGDLIGRNTGFLARKTIFKVKKEKGKK